jgi:hypothetical protein
MSNWGKVVSQLGRLGAGWLDTLSGAVGKVEAEPLQPLSPRALIVNYDPVLDLSTGQRLTQRMGWNKVEELVAGYVADIRECSGDLVQYRVVGRVDVDAFPPKADGFQYDPDSFLAVMERQAPAHAPDLVNYHYILQEQNLIERVLADEFDEVWLFGSPYGGFYESHMAGRGAFWCNAPALEGTDHCPKRFVMMGFSYQRGVGEMLEDLGHRAESILDKVYAHRLGEANLWKRFSRYDKIAPGQAEVGMMHFAPNSAQDYDWGNTTVVPSKCDDWLDFPNFKGAVRQVDCRDWGNGDIREHHKWWFKRLPKVAGRIGGVRNNWWHYIIDVNDPIFDR